MKTMSLKDPRRDSLESASDFRQDSNDPGSRTAYNLSCPNEPRSNSPLKGLQHLLEAEQELHDIFNRTKRDFWGWLPIGGERSPDSRKTAQQSNLSCSSFSQVKRPCFLDRMSHRTASLEGASSQESYRMSEDIERVACNPFKNNVFPE